MTITATAWKNKSGTSGRNCGCGTWKKHWLKFSEKVWPAACSVKGCTGTPALGAHVINPSVTGERIVPMCDSCNGLAEAFNLNDGVTCPSANTAATCG